jgi:carbamoyltransferase
MIRILGIHDGHNASVCLMEDGNVKWLIQEERLRREKNFDGFPSMAFEKIMQLEGITVKDIDHVALNGNYMPSPLNRARLLAVFNNYGGISSWVKSYLKSVPLIESAKRAVNRAERLSRLRYYGFDETRVRFIDHHECHASSAYFGNGNLDEPVLVLTNDGAGDRICATVSIGVGGSLKRISSVGEKHSVGLLYAMFTFLTGMIPLEHEYKLMGMAPYADSKGVRKVADEFHAMFQLSEEGLTWKFTKGYSIYTSLEYFKQFIFLKRFDHLMGGLQLFTEEFLMAWVKSAIKKTGVRKIALAGGTFMNVKANQRLIECDEVDEIFVFPSCGDESNAYGAAANIYASLAPTVSLQKLGSIYWGAEWSDDSIKFAYDHYGFKHSYTIKRSDDIEMELALILASGEVVARFKGREEFGARSLGNRAIIANPSKPEVIKEINEMIKCRDFWMPFACSILDQNMDDYVVWDRKKNLPHYMIMTYNTKLQSHSQLSGGIHPYDKTVRPQYVTREHNEDYWRLIERFKELTGIGGVLNTSLNLHGLPLVFKPEDAFEVIDNSGLRHLAIGNYLLCKQPNEK